MEELIKKDENKHKVKRFFQSCWYKFYFIICPMLFIPSFSILLEEYAEKIYAKTLKRILFRNALSK